MRAGKVTQYGIDAVTLTARNKRLVYCNLGAFGAVGPQKDKPGYDPLMQACSGIMALTGEPERPPVRVGVSIIDMGTGLWCTIGILAALYQRKLTVRGCIIDASLYETAVAWTANQSMMVRVGTTQGRGRRDRHTKRAQPIRTSGSAPSFARINQPVTA